MPTENRSSSTEMVSVPRELADRIQKRLDHAATAFKAAKPERDQLRALLDVPDPLVVPLTGPKEWLDSLRPAEQQPAEQHQDEADTFPPCDYCGTTPDYHPWHGSGLLRGVESRHIHACDECRGLLPAHPGQRQGELVAFPACKPKLSMSHDWDQGYSEGWSGCLEEAAKLGPLYTHPAPAEQEGEPDFKSDENALYIFSKLMAHKLAKKSSEGRSGWQECSQEDLTRMLREHVEKGDPVDVANFCMMLCANGMRIGPADAGEVERLRTDLACMTKSYESLGAVYAGTQKGFENMRAQLAERDALLRSALQDCIDIELMRMMRGSIYTNRLSDRIKATLAASAEPIKNGNTELSGAEPGSPVERDEQELFESVFPMPCSTTKFKGGYASTEFNAWDAHKFCDRWDGWKARAALERKQA